MSNWEELFGHHRPYPNQVDGIDTVLSTTKAGGYVALEGACGTGKTMLALVAALEAIRSDDFPYDRILVLTSVKQQLRQFEADLQAIEDQLPPGVDPFGSVTLVGKSDVCPYHLGETGRMTEQNLYDRCENLRERTRELVNAGRQPEALAARAKTDIDEFTVYETTSPYSSAMARIAPADGAGEVEYCPFYAQYLADSDPQDEPAVAIPFEYRGDGPLTPEKLIQRGLESGSCPHSLMGALLQDAEVVIGNYYHGFDPRTVSAFTGPLFDERTFLIVDEAHMLEPRVRDLASQDMAVQTIERARDEIADVIEFAKGTADAGAKSVAREAIASAEMDRATLSLVHSFLGDVIRVIDDILAGVELDGTTSVPLRDPATVERDSLTDGLEAAGHEPADWRAVEPVGAIVERVLNAVDGEERWRASPSVGRFLRAWWEGDHDSFFRMIELEERNRPLERRGWRRSYRARLSLQNCLPGRVIGETLDRFGGGILMSATLAPMAVFREVVGLNQLAGNGRPVETRRYGLTFPERNRLSLAVDAPKFTYSNRGAPGQETATRAIYADILEHVGRSPGNVLIGMPSYAEARWAASTLEDRLDRPILVDRSSDRETTEDLKSSFFRGGPKVLVTSLRGTLTEGVDYAGDRLIAAVICGVPIINTQDPTTRAIQTAYDRHFDDGFEQALVVPAVRKARQALGRVIRGPDEVGARILVDGRYVREGWDGVAQHLPPEEPYQPIDPDDVGRELDRFWESHGIGG